MFHAAHGAVAHVGQGEQGSLPRRRAGGRQSLTRSKGGATYAIALQWLRDDAVGLVLHRPHDHVVGFGNRDTELVDFHRLHVVAVGLRSEEHTSELQSLMRISYAVFCLKKKNSNQNRQTSYY